MNSIDLAILLIFILPLIVLSFTPQNPAPASFILWSAMSHNWDGVAGADGIEISIRPQDENGEIAKVAGKLDAVLLSRTGEVVECWSVHVPSDNYTNMHSNPIKLHYSSPHSLCESGTLDVNFTCMGKTLSDTRYNLPLGAV